MESKVVKDIVSDIPILNNYRGFYRIDKGWSSDEKYFIECDDGEKYLLRINSIEQQDIKEKEFLIMKEISKLGINMSDPIDFGISNNAVWWLMRTTGEWGSVKD